jgi:hypothetical protein
MKIWKHKYPQNTWAKEIVKILRSNPEYLKESIVDAPCGNGIIGHLVFNEFSNSKVVLLDNDKSLLESPYSQNEAIQTRVEDVFDFKINGKDNTWLLINSLFCLPNSSELISRNRDQFKYIIAICPNIGSSNFKYFTKKNPDFSNPSAIDIPSTVKLFQQHGYTLEFQKEITKVPFHKWNVFFDCIKLPFFLKNILFLLFEKILFFLSGQYTIIACKRSEKNNFVI